MYVLVIAFYSVSDQTALTYMTSGTFLKILGGGGSINDYTHIIIDEVHERDLHTDFILAILKIGLMNARKK